MSKKNIFDSKIICEKATEDNKLLGFWIYLMSDCIIFSVVFAVYAIISSHVELNFFSEHFYNLFLIFFETIILLLSSLSCGFMIIAMHEKKIRLFFVYLLITFFLGIIFLISEGIEFYELIQNHFKPSTSAFASSFFTLIGLHGLHILSGLIWLLCIIYQIINLGLTNAIRIRILCFSLFWHFLDIIWICIFTFVYLNGKI